MSFFADQVKPPSLKEMTVEQQAEAEVPRDFAGRPLILAPDGSNKRLPYSRASSFGDKLEDKSNLEQWGKRQMLRGAAIDPSILDRVPQGPARERGGDISKGDKKQLDNLVDRADEAVGSHDKATLGTDIHAATEFVDMGDSLEDKLVGFSPERKELLIERANAYYRKTSEFGLKWDSIEQFGVQDEVQVAGTWDRRGSIPFWPGHSQVIGDVKTSGSMDFAGIGFAVQLAVYAHSCAYSAADGSRTPHEDMDLQRALIIHVDRNLHGPVELFFVDIEVGWKYATLARQVILARRRGKDAISELDERQALILSTRTRDDLLALGDMIRTWPKHLRDLANGHYDGLAA